MTDHLTDTSMSLYFERGYVLRNKNFQSSELAWQWMLDDPEMYLAYKMLTAYNQSIAKHEFNRGFWS